MTDSIAIDLDIKGLDESFRAMGQFDDIAQDELTKALEKAMLLGERSTKKVSPVLTGRLRSSVAGRVTSALGIEVAGVLATNIEYGWILDRSSKTHYRRGPNAGNPTAGWFSETLKARKGAMAKYFHEGLRWVRIRLERLAGS